MRRGSWQFCVDGLGASKGSHLSSWELGESEVFEVVIGLGQIHDVGRRSHDGLRDGSCTRSNLLGVSTCRRSASEEELGVSKIFGDSPWTWRWSPRVNSDVQGPEHPAAWAAQGHGDDRQQEAASGGRATTRRSCSDSCKVAP